MKETSDGFVRADQIDLKSLDEQLEKHLNRVRTSIDNSKSNGDDDDNNNDDIGKLRRASSGINRTVTVAKERLEWEIDPSKLIIRTVIARGTFGTVHRGIYDGQDVAGQFLFLSFFFFKRNHCLI